MTVLDTRYDNTSELSVRVRRKRPVHRRSLQQFSCTNSSSPSRHLKGSGSYIHKISEKIDRRRILSSWLATKIFMIMIMIPAAALPIPARTRTRTSWWARTRRRERKRRQAECPCQGRWPQPTTCQQQRSRWQRQRQSQVSSSQQSGPSQYPSSSQLQRNVSPSLCTKTKRMKVKESIFWRQLRGRGVN